MRITTFIISLLLILLGSNSNLHGQSFPIEKGTDLNLSDDSGYLRLGPTTSINLVMDQNEIQSRNNGSGSSLFINNEGGNVTVGLFDSEINLKGFTRLGESAPLIATKLIKTTASSPVIAFSHGLDASKIISIEVISFEPSGGTAGNVYSHKQIASHNSTSVFLSDAVPTGGVYTAYFTYIK